MYALINLHYLFYQYLVLDLINYYKEWNFGLGLLILKYLYSPIFGNRCDNSSGPRIKLKLDFFDISFVYR